MKIFIYCYTIEDGHIWKFVWHEQQPANCEPLKESSNFNFEKLKGEGCDSS